MSDIVFPDALPLLSPGHHEPGSGRACAMDAVSILLGTPEQGDNPRTVHPLLRVAVMFVNDTCSDAQRQQLWPLLTDLNGTAENDLGLISRAAASALAAAGRACLISTGVMQPMTTGLLDAEMVRRAAEKSTDKDVVHAAAFAISRQAVRAGEAGVGVQYVSALLDAWRQLHIAQPQVRPVELVDLDWSQLEALLPSRVATDTA